MKMKKYLLPGMLATMMFAACTNEEIVSQQIETDAPEVDLSNRPVAGMVDLNFGPQTRATLDNDQNFNTLVWEDTESDNIGARLIDKVKDASKWIPFNRYEADPSYAWTNYLYKKIAGEERWETEALLVEGNYMFYAPYDKDARVRDLLTVNFPLHQTVNTEDAGVEGVEANTSAIKQFYNNNYEAPHDKDYVFALGYAFISADIDLTAIEPAMTHLYAYPQITLVNKQTELDGVYSNDKEAKAVDVVIDKIYVSSSNIKAAYKTNHAGFIANLREGYDDVTRKVGGKDVTEDGGEDGAWRNSVNRLKTAKTTQILTPQGDQKEIEIDFEPNLTIPAGEEFSFHMILPAEEYKDLKITKVVLEGEKAFYNEWSADAEDVDYAEGLTEFSPYVYSQTAVDKTLTYAPQMRYAVEEYNFPTSGNPSLKASAGALATFTLGGYIGDYKAPRLGIKYLTEEDANKAGASVEESLENYLASLKDNTTRTIEESDATFTLYKYTAEEGNKSTSDNIYEDYAQLVLNQELLDLVNEYLDGGSIGFTSKMTVSGEFEANNSQLEHVGGLKQIDNSNITLNGVRIDGDAEFNGKAIVVSTIAGNAIFNGELADDWDNWVLSNIVVTNSATFNNGGSVRGSIGENAYFNTGNATVEAKIKGTAYFNDGTATIQGGATSNGAEIQNATVSINSGDLNGITVYNNGTLNLNKAYADRIAVGKQVWNSTTKKYEWKSGTLNINADQSAANVTFNNGAVVIDADTKVAFAATWNNDAATKLTNNGTIESALTVPAKGTYVHGENAVVNADITNTGTIENNGDILVANNTGTVKAVGKTTHTTVEAGMGTIGNDDLAYVSANDEQTVYYTFKNEVDEEAIEKFDAETYAINKVIFNKAVTLSRALSESLPVMKGVTALEFNANLSLAANAMVGVNVTDVYVNNSVTFSGFDKSKSGLGFKKGTNINVAKGKTLTVSYLSIATLNKAENINITLAENAKLVVKNANVAIGKGTVPAYTSIDKGTVQCGYYSETGIVPENLVLSGTTYTVYSPIGLKELAALVNDGDDLKGYTVELANNIDLNNEAWTPIGTKAKPFNGVFDGKNFTISNLNVEGVSDLGLFGHTYNFATIKNVTVKNATVKGNHNVGTILGMGYAEILNCKVENATVECKQGNNEDGDKVGAIVGRLGEGASMKVTGCSAKDCSVSAGRDGGQLIGARYTSNIVENNTINNVTVTDNKSYTGSEPKHIQVAESGRIING